MSASRFFGHTVGPWKADGEFIFGGQGKDGPDAVAKVFEIYGDPTGEAIKANAALIAAAPALLTDNTQLRAELTCQGCKMGISPSQVFRCVDCESPYHKHCLKKHCAKDRADLLAENARLREALVTAEKRLDFISGCTLLHGETEGHKLNFGVVCKGLEEVRAALAGGK